jgi:hypothetical protein
MCCEFIFLFIYCHLQHFRLSYESLVIFQFHSFAHIYCLFCVCICSVIQHHRCHRFNARTPTHTQCDVIHEYSSTWSAIVVKWWLQIVIYLCWLSVWTCLVYTLFGYIRKYFSFSSNWNWNFFNFILHSLAQLFTICSMILCSLHFYNPHIFNLLSYSILYNYFSIALFYSIQHQHCMNELNWIVKISSQTKNPQSAEKVNQSIWIFVSTMQISVYEQTSLRWNEMKIFSNLNFTSFYLNLQHDIRSTLLSLSIFIL